MVALVVRQSHRYYYQLVYGIEKGHGREGRTETRESFSTEGFEAHFVGCVAQIIIFIWDASYECGLERCALFDNVFDLGR